MLCYGHADSMSELLKNRWPTSLSITCFLLDVKNAVLDLSSQKSLIIFQFSVMVLPFVPEILGASAGGQGRAPISMSEPLLWSHFGVFEAFILADMSPYLV